MIKKGSELLIKLFYIPTTQIYLKFLICEKTNDGTYILKNYKDHYCFQDMHLLVIITTLIMILVFFLYSFIFIKFDFCPMINTIQIDNKYTSKFDSYIFIMKQFLIIYNTVLFDQNFQITFQSIIQLFLFYILKEFQKSLPFYKSAMNKMYLILLNSIFVSSLFGIIQMLLTIKHVIIYYLIINLIQISLVLSFKNRLQYIELSNFENSITLNIDSVCLYYRKFIQQLFQKQYEDIVISKIILLKHQRICKIKKCPLRQLTFANMKQQFYNHSLKQAVISSMNQFLHQSINDQIQKYKQNAQFRIIYCLFQIEVLNRLTQNYQYITEQLDSLELTMEEQYIFCFFQKHIESNSDDKSSQNEQNEQITNTIVNQTFTLLIEKQIYEYQEFWRTIMHDRPDLIKVRKSSRQINENEKMLSDFMESIDIKNLQNMKYFLTYIQYQQLILFKHNHANNYLRILRREIEQAELSMSDAILCNQFSGMKIPQIKMENRNNELIITQVNSYLSKMISQEEQELIGQKIDIILPKCIRKLHSNYVQKFLEEKKFNHKLVKFTTLLSSDQFLIPVLINFQGHINDLENKTQFFVNVYKVQEYQDSCYILMDENMRIQNTSKNSKVILGTDRFGLLQKPHIKNWISNFDQIFKNGGNFNKICLLQRIVDANEFKNSGRLFNVEGLFMKNYSTHEQYWLFKIDPKDSQTISMINPPVKILQKYDLKNKIMENIDEALLSMKKRSLVNMKTEIEEKNKKKQNSIQKNQFYYQGIKLIRSKNNNLYEIKEENIDNELIDDVIKEEIENYNLIELEHELRENDDSLTLTSDLKYSLLLESLSYGYLFEVIRIMIYSCITFIVALFCWIFYNFYFSVQHIKEYTFMIHLLMRKLYHFMYIGIIIQNSLNIMANTLSTDFNSNINYFDEAVEEYLSEISYLDKSLFEYKDYPSIINEHFVNVQFLNYSQTVSIRALEQQLRGSIYNVKEDLKSHQELLFTFNESTYFITHNIFNSYYYSINLLVYSLVNEITIESETRQKQNTYILFVLILFVIVGLTVFLYLYKKTQKLNMKLMNFFLKIPEIYFLKRIQHIKRFQINFQQLKEEDLEPTSNQQFVRKKFYKNGFSLFNFPIYIFLIIIVVILSGENIFVNLYQNKILVQILSNVGDIAQIHQIQKTYLTNFSTITQIMNNTDQKFDYENVLQKQEAFQNDFKIIISQFYHHIKKIDIFSNDFKFEIYQVYQLEICKFSEEIEECQEVLNSLGFDSIYQYTLSLFSYFQYLNSQIQNKSININQGNQLYLKFKDLIVLIHYVSENLEDKIITTYLNQYERAQNIIVIFLSFMLVSMFCYGIFCQIYFVSKVKEKLERTKETLQLVSLSSIAEFDYLKQHLAELLSNQFKQTQKIKNNYSNFFLMAI